MSSNNGTSGIGGVRNLRAIFENKPSEDQSASPPSRGRSPTHSEASTHSRPVSKVRTSFVVVERPGDSDERPHWGLRKASDVTTMAEIKQEVDDTSLVNFVSDTFNPPAQPNGVHDDSDSQPRRDDNEQETTQNELGNILKGSPFEASPPTSELNLKGSGTAEPPRSPLSQKRNLAASRVNGTTTPGTQSKSLSSPRVQPKSIGNKIKDAVTSNLNQRPPPTKLDTSQGAKPIETPPTRQTPLAKPSVKSPTSPKTLRAPVSPRMEKPTVRGSAAKPMAVGESAQSTTPPEQANKSPTQPREMKHPSLNTQSSTTTGQGPSSPKSNRGRPTTKPSSPEAKPKSARAPAFAAGPTAASATKSINSTTLGRKPTVIRRDPPPAKTTTSTVPVVKKAGRTSLPAQTNGTDRTKPRTSAARKAPDEGFLARMMRPTTSSAHKAHEKVAPSSPPQSKRAAPVPTAKGKMRTSLTRSDEDKENSHRGRQETRSSPSTVKSAQIDTNGDDKGESQPLNDITPRVEAVEASADSNTDPLEASSA